jgi:hypothetical protein
MDEARVGYISFTHDHWRLVSIEAKEFVKKITKRQVSTDGCLQ